MPGRFEWKILGAVLLVAVLSTGTAADALSYALKGMLGFWQQEQQAPDPGTRAAEVFRAYFIDRKDEFRRRARELAARRPTRIADMAGTDSLLRARLLEGETVVGETWEAPPEVQARLREGAPVLEPLPGTDPEQTLELTFGIPLDMYDRFIELTRALGREQQREQAFGATVAQYIRDYLVFVVVLLAVVCLAGLFFARRATQRLARLRDAVQRVGAGDLAVQIGPTGRDELDDVARAFDGMVRELGDARSRLEYLQKVSAWQEVARRLAHEIKNPLTPIQLAVQELAIKYAGQDAGYRRLLDTAVELLKEEITALRRLVDDFSAFAKLPKVEPAPLDLRGFLVELPRLHPVWAPHLQVMPPASEVRAVCDRSLFSRVLANLIENAVQAAEGAGKQPQVRLSLHARPARGRAAIVVEDNGPGVPAADRQRIFDPYVTTKPSGTGLGLAIVRKIVIDHGGDISVAAEPSALGGARFEVEIPLAEG
jgi:nitrogen fixation/metabolism regulation signal transduction histidine kinase